MNGIEPPGPHPYSRPGFRALLAGENIFLVDLLISKDATQRRPPNGGGKKIANVSLQPPGWSKRGKKIQADKMVGTLAVNVFVRLFLFTSIEPPTHRTHEEHHRNELSFLFEIWNSTFFCASQEIGPRATFTKRKFFRLLFHEKNMDSDGLVEWKQSHK